MFKLFKRKPKKIYCVRWKDEDKDICQDIVRAKDIAEAWATVKNEHGWRAIACLSITEIETEEFKGEVK